MPSQGPCTNGWDSRRGASARPCSRAPSPPAATGPRIKNGVVSKRWIGALGGNMTKRSKNGGCELDVSARCGVDASEGVSTCTASSVKV
eukprot:scaffold69944_cov65-Phaeocystis_antarctica.AAC.3